MHLWLGRGILARRLNKDGDYFMNSQRMELLQYEILKEVASKGPVKTSVLGVTSESCKEIFRDYPEEMMTCVQSLVREGLLEGVSGAGPFYKWATGSITPEGYAVLEQWQQEPPEKKDIGFKK